MLYQQLKEANINALKTHNTVQRSVLSVVLNKIKLAEIDKRAQNAELTDADVVAVLQKSIKELTEEKEAFQKAGRAENVATLSEQMEFLNGFLPKMMSAEEIKAEILSLTQPAVSNHINQLEKECNAKLFCRL